MTFEEYDKKLTELNDRWTEQYEILKEEYVKSIPGLPYLETGDVIKITFPDSDEVWEGDRNKTIFFVFEQYYISADGKVSIDLNYRDPQGGCSYRWPLPSGTSLEIVK